MENNELKNKIFTGAIWKYMERLGAQLVTFIVSIVLARLLEPTEYGMIAILSVFISISNILVEAGFGTALVQKKDADMDDYSSVLLFSTYISVILYFLIFMAAPFVGDFYNNENLVAPLRVLALQIPISGIKSVQQSYISKKLEFRKFFFSTLGGTLISAIVGIAMAYCGMGVWALVAQTLINSFVDMFILAITIGWKLRLYFSFSRIKTLWGYGFNLMLSSLFSTICSNLRNLLIGKVYTSEDLAYYNRGKQFPKLLTDNIDTSLGSVLLPAFSLVQDKPQEMKKILKKSIKLSTYVLYPILIGLACVSDNLVRLLLTEKWMFCVPYLRMACVIFILMPLQSGNLRVVLAVGKSKVYFYMEVAKNLVNILLIVISLHMGILILAASEILVNFICYFINSWITKKEIDYGRVEQILDVLPNLLCSIVMGIVVLSLGLLKTNYVIIFVLQILCGVIIYIILSFFTRNDNFFYIINLLKKKITKTN